MREYLYKMFEGIVYPDGKLIVALFLFIAIDLLTGIRKSRLKGIATTSNGLRMTINKATTYFSFLSSVFIITNVSKPGTDSPFVDLFLDNSLNTVLFISIYIEFKSVLENLKEANPKSDIVKFFVAPLHSALILNFKNFPWFKENKN